MLKSRSILLRVVMLLLVVLATAGIVGSSVPPATWFLPEGATLTANQIVDLFDTHQLYFNVQSTNYSNGEIRGEITPSAVIYQADAGNPFAPNPANNPVTFAALLGGDQVWPRSVITNASGYGSVTIDPLTRQLTGFIVTSGIVGKAARIHDGLPGTNGAFVLTLEGGPVVWTVPANTLLNDAQIARLSAGAYYLDVQSDAFLDGEIRGQLNQQVRFATLKGANEVPPVTSSASGVGVLALNPVTRQFSGFVKVAGLGSAVTSAVIRLGDSATNGPGIIDLVNSGNGIWSLPIIDNPVLSNAVVAAFNNDAIYFDIRTQANPGGELRGQLMKAGIRIGTAGLDGFKEIPPVSTLATGTGLLAWNSATEQVSGSVKTDGISGTAANIHSGSVSTNGPALIPLTTTSPVTVTPTPGISFGLDIQGIFTTSCARAPFCHVPGGRTPMSLQSGVSYANIINILVPGDSASSYLFQRVSVNDPPAFPQMPLNRPPLSLATQDLIKNWIDRGALFDFYPENLTAVTVTAAAAPNGTITPAGPATVSQGTNQTYTITPNAGFAVANLVVDGTLLPGSTSYTFANVTTDHYINAYFAPSDLTVIVAAGPNGTISPVGTTAVTLGSSLTCTVTPDTGFKVAALVVDGVQLPGTTSYTFTNVAANHYINAYFEPAPAFTINATAAANGTISPSGSNVVAGGTNQSFTITPGAGFMVTALVVDGTLLPAATTYTFSNVTADHYINAYFAPLPATVTITAAAAPNGIISPAGATTVAVGTNQTFTITPDAGFTVTNLVVDGILLPGATSYTFTNVAADHYINAYFQ